TGNTVIDALLGIVDILHADTETSAKLRGRFALAEDKRTILVTGHRRESFGGGFERICSALAQLAQRDDVQIVYPMHLNPNVKAPVEERLGSLPNVRLMPPQDYLPFVYL